MLHWHFIIEKNSGVFFLFSVSTLHRYTTKLNIKMKSENYWLTMCFNHIDWVEKWSIVFLSEIFFFKLNFQLIDNLIFRIKYYNVIKLKVLKGYEYGPVCNIFNVMEKIKNSHRHNIIHKAIKTKNIPWEIRIIIRICFFFCAEFKITLCLTDFSCFLMSEWPKISATENHIHTHERREWK